MPTTSRGLITAVAGALAVALTLTYNLGPSTQ